MKNLQHGLLLIAGETAGGYSAQSSLRARLLQEPMRQAAAIFKPGRYIQRICNFKSEQLIFFESIRKVESKHSPKFEKFESIRIEKLTLIQKFEKIE